MKTLRRHPREPIRGRVRVTWSPPNGSSQYVVCDAVDISESGLRISSKEALPVGQYVHMQVDALGLRGPASVRSCNHTKQRHEIGLEFSNGVRWKKAERADPSLAAQVRS